MKGIELEANRDNSIIASGHSYQSSEPGITITMNGIFEKKYRKAVHEKMILFICQNLWALGTY